MFNTFSHGLLFWKCFTMTQYLIKTITHNTGEVFHDVVKARDNEVFTLVDAESEDEAVAKAKDKIQCPNCESWNTVYEYVYERNEPVFLLFECIDCKFSYTNYIKKGQ